jgi:hypothetical protein
MWVALPKTSSSPGAPCTLAAGLPDAGVDGTADVAVPPQAVNTVARITPPTARRVADLVGLRFAKLERFMFITPR